MATAAKSTANTTEIPELATKVREQLLATVQQGQKLSVDAAQKWVDAVSALPLREVPAVPGLPVPSVEAATVFAFDIAGDLLNAQRDYALKLAEVFTPATAV
jgi:hypothetical protein